ncbi:MAG: hypothetical protein D5R97_05480 [Candidatus Syntrophonatronum acetioxidans]|uniref:Uncharacterized protein n=1 Tax=Candidatus Syntrophonatronum acetioxidans TaxID=1795816 RepID=A0A424YED3_9FIRM|nr:MAG: hypothetical protein D5R97_05480 [Candidatus Syntrophonatronum acetioxidans]
MAKKGKKKYHVKSLLIGFTAGILVVSFLSGIIFNYMTQKGVVVYIDSEEVATSVEGQVAELTRQQIPIYLEEAKIEIPQMVDKQMRGQLNKGKLEIAGFSFSLPEEFILSLEEILKENMKAGIYNIVDDIDSEELAEDLGCHAYEIVKRTLEKEYRGKSFTVEPLGWFSIPVTIEIKDNSSSPA